MRRVRSWGRGVAIGCAAVIVGHGIAVASASEAADGWLPPVAITTPTAGETWPVVAADGAGNAIAAWNDGNAGRVRASIRRANGTWSAPTTLGTLGPAIGHPAIAMNRRGDAVVAWERWKDATIRAAYRPAGGSWSVSERVSAPYASGFVPKVAIDDSGIATVAWETQDEQGDVYDVLTSRRSTHGWSLARRIGRSFGDGESVRVAVDGKGNTFAVWQDKIGSDVRIRAARRPVNESWSAPVIISPSGRQATEAALAAGGGRAVATWRSEDENTNQSVVVSSRAGTTGSWSSPVMLSGSWHRAHSPDIAADGQGNAIAVWSAHDHDMGVVQAARQSPDGSWSAGTTLSIANPGELAAYAATDITRHGRAVATWTDMRRRAVSAARMNPDGSWGAPATISAGDAAQEPSDVAIDGQGNPFAVWWFRSTEQRLVRAAGADWGGPFTTITKPSANGQTSTTFSVAWSAVDAFTHATATDVRYRTAPWNGPYGAYASWREDAAATGSASMTGTPGTSYCFAGQSTDATDLTGPWSNERCTAVPLDDRAMKAAGGWTRDTNSGYFQGTRTYTKTYGATLTLDGAQGRYFALQATRCSGCGKVQVTLNGASLGTFDLASSSTLRKQLIPVKTFNTVQSGQVRIRVASGTGKAVYIDGLVVRR